MKSWTSLTLSAAAVVVVAACSIGQLTQLQELRVTWEEIDEELDLSPLSNLRQLKRLSVGDGMFYIFFNSLNQKQTENVY